MSRQAKPEAHRIRRMTGYDGERASRREGDAGSCRSRGERVRAPALGQLEPDVIGARIGLDAMAGETIGNQGLAQARIGPLAANEIGCRAVGEQTSARG